MCFSGTGVGELIAAVDNRADYAIVSRYLDAPREPDERKPRFRMAVANSERVGETTGVLKNGPASRNATSRRPVRILGLTTPAPALQIGSTPAGTSSPTPPSGVAPSNS